MSLEKELEKMKEEAGDQDLENISTDSDDN